MRVYVLNGSAAKGKSSFVKYCEEAGKTCGIAVRNVSSITPAKKALEILCGYKDGEEKENSEKALRLRKALSELKNISVEINDYPFRYISDIIDKAEKERYSGVLFIDIREPQEIEKLRSKYKFIRTIIVRNCNVEDTKSNIADANVEEYGYDVVIDNSGTLDDLRRVAERFISKVSERC